MRHKLSFNMLHIVQLLYTFPISTVLVQYNHTQQFTANVYLLQQFSTLVHRVFLCFCASIPSNMVQCLTQSDNLCTPHVQTTKSGDSNRNQENSPLGVFQRFRGVLEHTLTNSNGFNINLSTDSAELLPIITKPQ